MSVRPGREFLATCRPTTIPDDVLQAMHRPAVAAEEEEALRTGLSLGMTLIDTAEIYGNGHSEELISRVIAGQRARVFLVSKVPPTHLNGRWYGTCLRGEPRLARYGSS
jgi:aryl-alcohol dehydrogenase-like predicted oxidoreductase